MCYEIFAKKANLTRHKKTKHLLQIMSYLCEHCDKQFIRKEHLQRHVISCQQISTGPTGVQEPVIHKCDQCDSAFKSSTSLKNHKKVHKYHVLMYI